MCVESGVLDFFKALADASRLRMLGLLADGERSVDELATLLGLRPPTVSHHLQRLKALGLVSMRGDGTTHLYRLEVQSLRRLAREALNVDKLTSLPPTAETSGDAWERKVLRDFLVGERLKDIPASRKKREVVLRWLARDFEPGRRYAETQVNDVLAAHHEDVATLRRELVGARLLQRERSVYWRAA
jgi:DNA-binding transcriptional ArsR family regulator